MTEIGDLVHIVFEPFSVLDDVTESCSSDGPFRWSELRPNVNEGRRDWTDEDSDVVESA